MTEAEYRKEEMREGIVFANCNVAVEGNVTYLPIYMVMFLEKEPGEEVIMEPVTFKKNQIQRYRDKEVLP